GAEVMRFSPRQSDVMIRGRHSYLQNGLRSQTNLRPGAGTQMGDRHGRLCLVRGHVPQLRRSSRNRPTYPVDVYVSGCPPRPEALLEGLMKLQHKIEGEKAIADQKKDLLQVLS